jgi:hypothetical protein
MFCRLEVMLGRTSQYSSVDEETWFRVPAGLCQQSVVSFVVVTVSPQGELCDDTQKLATTIFLHVFPKLSCIAIPLFCYK